MHYNIDRLTSVFIRARQCRAQTTVQCTVVILNESLLGDEIVGKIYFL